MFLKTFIALFFSFGACVAHASSTAVSAPALVMTNGYTGDQHLAGTEQDAQTLRPLFDATELRNASAALMLASLYAFAAEQQCKAPNAPTRVVWYSGYADNSQDTLVLFGQKLDKLAFTDLLSALSKSSCRFVVGVDAHSNKVALTLPANVVVIWPDKAGGKGQDSLAGGVLTEAFAAAVKNKRTWKPADLTAALQVLAAALTKADQKPWVQSGDADETIRLGGEVR